MGLGVFYGGKKQGQHSITNEGTILHSTVETASHPASSAETFVIAEEEGGPRWMSLTNRSSENSSLDSLRLLDTTEHSSRHLDTCLLIPLSHSVNTVWSGDRERGLWRQTFKSVKILLLS